jgi:hypothetical protein
LRLAINHTSFQHGLLEKWFDSDRDQGLLKSNTGSFDVVLFPVNWNPDFRKIREKLAKCQLVNCLTN